MTVGGNVGGLKPDQKRRLERLASRRVPPDEVISNPLANDMAALSREIRRQVGLLIWRDGTIAAVLVGNEHEILIPNISHLRFGKGPLRGVRWVHTHLKNEPLTADDFTDLALLGFDLVAAIGVLPTGAAGLLHVSHLLPENPEGKRYTTLPAAPVHLWRLPLQPFLDALSTEMEAPTATRVVDDGRERAILIGATLQPSGEQERALDELSDLATSARIVPIGRVIQRLKSAHPKYLLGHGKLKETIIAAVQQRADLLIFEPSLTPLQVREIGALTEMKVLDRTQLILDIFAQRAKTREAKVQVELAQLRHRLPLLSARSTSLSRLSGGIGGRGPGETRLEIDLRRARDRIARLEREHELLSQARARRREQRVDRQTPIVSIVGYTNAGKSTLLNALTHSQISTGDLLFETLETTTRRLRFPREREVVLTDTVGFIQSLPKELLGAFRATLDELKDAHLLIHLVNASHPEFVSQMMAVEQILTDLELASTPRLLVFNKQDQIGPERAAALAAHHNAIAISAIEPATLLPLLRAIEAHLWQGNSHRVSGFAGRMPAPQVGQASCLPSFGQPQRVTKT